MSRSGRFVDGVIFGYFYQVLVLLAGLWLTPFLIRHLGANQYGLWLIGLQIVGYLMLADVGVLALLPRSVAEATGSTTGHERDVAVSRVLAGTVTTVLWQTLFVAIVSLATWLWMSGKWPALSGPAAWMFGSFVVLFPARIFAATLQGLQEQGFVARVQSASWAVGTLLNVGLVLVGAGLYALAAGWIGTQVVASAVQAYRFLTRYRCMLPTRDSLQSSRMREVIGRGFWVSVSQISATLINGVDILLIGATYGPAATIVYTCTVKLVTIVGNQPQLIMQMAIPAMTELRAGGNREHLMRVVSALAQGMILITGLLCIPPLLFNNTFVSLWVGDQYYGGFALTSLAVLRTILAQVNLTFSYAAFAAGFERRVAITNLVSGIVTFALMAHFLRSAGLTAVPIVQMVTVVTISLPANALLLSRVTGKSIRATLMPAASSLGGICIFGCASLAVTSYWRPHTWPGLFLAAGALAIAYSVVFLPFVMRSSLSPYLSLLVTRVQHSIHGQTARAAGRTS